MKKLKTGLIGCGGFMRGMHVPNLKTSPYYTVHATCDLNEKAAESLCTELGAVYHTTDIEKLLKDPEIDVVVISTRHDTHAELSVKAAEAGKHILCEKPMGLNIEECRKVAAAVKKNNVKYTVGYNRGMAPLVTKASNLLKDTKGKRMIYHRIQALFPADVWTHDPAVGGGRFVGEGCHIFDLICELVPSVPVSVYASGGTFLDPAKVKIPDSGIITITFKDGSVGTTLINSFGNPDFPKEVTEIYCEGTVIYINDFKEMDCYGFDVNGKTSTTLKQQDKGHKIEIEKLALAILENGEPPNGIKNAIRAALISYLVNESIATGKPVEIKLT